MAVTVRPATVDDVPWLIEQLRQFAEFFGSNRSLFEDEGYARAVLPTLIEQHPFFLAVQGDERIGFISGMLAPHPWNPRITLLSEAFWWVSEAHRGGRAGLMLLDAFLSVGMAKADWIVFTLEEKSPVNPATLERRGFHLHERAYLLEVTR